MAIIENAKYNSLPEQVEENKENIKKLDDAIAEIDPEAITSVIDQVATNTSDISNIKGEQITQNNNIGLNALAITSEATNRKALIDVDASGNTKVKAQAGKDIDLYSSNKIQVYGDEGADVSDDYGDAVSVLKDTIILETTSHDLILNEDGTLKFNGNKIGENGHLTFENIYDKNGNPRFIEGVGVVRASTSADVTFTYNKWSLSGSHIMFVVCGEIPTGKTISAPNQINIDYTLPQWIFDKIKVTKGLTVSISNINFYNATNTINFTKLFSLNKGSTITLQQVESFTTTADVSFRIQFDLLIDNE